MPLDIENEITKLRSVPDVGRFLATALSRVSDAVNQLGTSVAADPTTTLPAPGSIQAVNVASNAQGLVHVTLTHNLETQRNTRYFVEWSADKNFNSNVHVEDLGAGRGRVLQFPNGTFYFRGYHQPQGGQPSVPVNFGGTVPTGITVASSSTLSLLPSAGSGTGSPDGSQPGWGLGKTLFRLPLGPKRSNQA